MSPFLVSVLHDQQRLQGVTMKKQTSSTVFMAFLGLIWIAFPGGMAAQGSAPVLVAAGDGGNPEPLLLTGLAVDARIVGMVAETRMTMTFRNPHDRQLSGDLYFPLPEGAMVSGYALDITGPMVDGVVVEKEKARRTFETLSRQRIDPGIVEWVKGNQFKTRVFPIPANGQRTIMVRYLSELFPQGGAVLYQLPLGFSVKIKAVSLRVEVAGADVAPRIRSGGPANFAFKRWQRNLVAETKLNDVSLPRDLVIEVPDAGSPRVAVEKDGNGETYFLVSAFPGEIAVAGADKSAAPGRVVVLWDASGSRAKGDHQREFEFIKAYFARFRGETIAVELVIFRNESEPPMKMQLRNGDAGELLAMLGRVDYDGGTSIGCLAAAGNGARPDLYLLFSDGISNFVDDDPAKFNAPLYVFCSASQADHPFLHYLAENNDGRFFNLAQVTAAEAARAVGSPPLRFSGCETGADLVRDTFPRSSRAVGTRFLLAGKLVAEMADLVLDFSRGGKLEKKFRFRVSRAAAAEGELLRTFWAQKKIEELMIFSRRNEKELVETGKTFGLVTPGTSLIVLDSLDQYVEHRIPPPKSLPEMRRLYFERVEQADSQRKRFEKDRLETVFSLWAQRLDWWRTDFSKLSESKRGNPAGPRPGGGPADARLGDRGDAAVQGTVLMDDGSTVPGVSLTLKGAEITQVTVFSDEDGGFRFSHVPPGAYELLAELEGFQAVHFRGLRVRRGRVTERNVVMRTAAIMEQVTVASGDGEEWAGDGVSGGVEGGVEGGVVGGVLGGVEGGAPGASASAPGKASEPAIAIQPWNPQTSYIQALKEAAHGAEYAVYIKQRDVHGSSPGFYLDCADFFFQRKESALGLRILSNIAEMELEEPSLLRILGYRLRQLGFLELSARVLEEVLKLRPEEPQSHRDLALVLAEQKKFERSIQLLNHVVMNEWERFAEIELIALDELNHVLAEARAAGMTEFSVSPRLVQLMDLDIRIVMTWDSDMTDIDLWVTEPTGEKAFYSHNRTSSGGLVSRDFTEGYGPEVYLIRKARPGTYKIEANYYGSRSNRLIGPVTVQVDVFTHWGRPNERKKSLTLRLDQAKDVVAIGEIEF